MTEDKATSSSARKKAPSRQAHACPVCGVIYSRAEFVRRHFLSKHAPKPLACINCDATFSRRDLLQRHVKLFHPDTAVPTPTDTAPEPDIPAPVPVPSRSTSAASYASSASDVTGGATGALFGNWISSSPEPMAGGATLPDDMRLPTPPPPLGGQPSTSSSQRTATYPPPRLPYQPYHAPSLPPPSLPHTPIPRAFPSSSHSSFSTNASSSMPSAPYRAFTAPAGYDPAAALQLAGLPPVPASSSGPSRQASYSDASVQTDLRAQHIPPALTAAPDQGGLAQAGVHGPPLSDDALAALLQRMAPHPHSDFQMQYGHSTHSPHMQSAMQPNLGGSPHVGLSPPQRMQHQSPVQAPAPDTQAQQQQQQTLPGQPHPQTLSMATLQAFGLGIGAMPYPLQLPPARQRQSSGGAPQMPQDHQQPWG